MNLHPSGQGGSSIQRVLVTGGAGFLGSHLCERLLRDGSEVICVDNFLTGSRANVDHLRGNSRFSLVDHNITRPFHPEGEVTWVMHLASPASPPAYLSNPIHTMKVGSIGTINALGIAKAHGARFFLASTSEIYGDPEVRPQPETYRGSVSTTGPRGVYDEAKRFAEAVTMAYHTDHGVDTRIIRIFNTYGPRLAPSDGRAVSNFIAQALSGKPLTIYGDGSQTRSFCYVDDLIDGMLLLMQRGDAEPVNVGNPDERSIKEIAELVLEMTGADVGIDYLPLPVDDPRVRCPDIALAREKLGWEPTISLRDGLERTIAWFRTQIPATG
jgi:dTDP-glucose 4,6-dehydratase